MKILMISDFYPPYLGGAERAVADLSHELSVRGHDVEVATLWYEGLARREYDGAVLVHRLSGVTGRLPFLYRQAERQFHPPFPDPLLALQLRRLIAATQPAIVHGHTWMLFSALPLQASLGFPVVATLHDYALICPKKNLLYREETPCEFGLSTHCLRCAPDLYGRAKGWAVTAGLPAGRAWLHGVHTFTAISTYVEEVHRRDPMLRDYRINTIPNFVPDALLQTAPGAPLEDLPPEYVLFVGQLSRHKGVQVLLDAYARLRTDVPLVLIGTVKPDSPPFPESVIVLRDMPHEAIIRAMDHCRFVVSPAIWPEPFGLVTIEAMARGRAVIASGLGGALDIVQDGVTGRLTPVGDVEALRGAIQALLDAPHTAARMGSAGRARCEAHFSSSAVIGQFEALYMAARVEGNA